MKGLTKLSDAELWDEMWGNIYGLPTPEMEAARLKYIEFLYYEAERRGLTGPNLGPNGRGSRCD